MVAKCYSQLQACLYLDPHAPKENKGHMRIQMQRLCFMPEALHSTFLRFAVGSLQLPECSCQALWQLLIMILYSIVHDTA